ncbi:MULTISPECIES: hypothetical protein [Bacillus subtilis group]|uniref:hypothetical protein n=1 Tax=Bacillus subtilis group TaxID=653685 RepID=UPI001B297ED3|nr:MULTISPECIES: hypothetical protein [Bacillus subtilis group]MED4337903.1 hypothetical protein [Bacillus licheniformis]MED4371093.1 hypothetical protein [Bacillus licheniformis]GIN55005.1 hypothetical protein J36TS2_38990 [Bacillus paralicheniformis]
MNYTINVKYVPPYQIGKQFNLVYNFETKKVSFTKDKGTVFTDKETVNKLLVDMIMNRENYQHLVENSSYLDVSVKKVNNGYVYFDDQLTINF